MNVYTWGRGEDGQLGLGDTSDQVEPNRVTTLTNQRVKHVVCGSGHTVVLLEDGQVYTWGRGDDGRLGHGDRGWKYVPRLVLAFSGVKIVGVACGSYHSAAIAENGHLFTWGGGMYGKLGHGDEFGHSLPCLVKGLTGFVVKQVACGSRHTVAVVEEDSQVFSWGDKENGVSGHGEVEGHQYVPRLIDALSFMDVTQISACGFHSAAVTRSGTVLTWGEGKFGRLGHGSEVNVTIPLIVEGLEDVSSVMCGGFHTAAITYKGQLYTWGGGEHGQLGHGDKVNRHSPTLVKAVAAINIVQITCGWSHSAGLCDSGVVYTWGNGDHGKLGHGDTTKVTLPKAINALCDRRIIAVASYNEHTAALEIVESDSPSTFTSDIGKLLDQEDFSDVTFLVEGRAIHAHRAVLAARCDQFRAMFLSGMKESHDKDIEIASTGYDTFKLLLTYLYTDTVDDVTVEEIVKLYMTADLYTLDRLKELCETRLQNQLCHDNAPALLSLADEMGSTYIRNVCLQYIVRHFDQVSKVDAFFGLSRELLMEVLKLR